MRVTSTRSGCVTTEAGTGLYQGDIPEAYLSLHLPILTEGGLDVKLGKFVSLEGAETVDPRTNAFYSHTYIFNFGIPANHTGALFTLHTHELARSHRRRDPRREHQHRRQ